MARPQAARPPAAQNFVIELVIELTSPTVAIDRFSFTIMMLGLSWHCNRSTVLYCYICYI